MLLIAATVGCSGGSSAPTTTPATHTPPDLAGFLHLPVATPSACPPSRNGATVGRQSPWVGHVDVSVFVRPGASAGVRRSLRRDLSRPPAVTKVYPESRRQAFEEFRRLYTCSDQVDRRRIPASYRLVLLPVTQADRDQLVRRFRDLPGVSSVSCDPANPCVDALTDG